MGWLSRKVASWGTSAQKREIEEVVTKLSALDSDEVAAMVVAAAIWRNRLLEVEGIDLLRPVAALIERPNLTFLLSRSVQKLQAAGDHAASAGLIVWVHSLRALTDPLLRPHGRAMWRELARGFPHVPQAAAGFEELTGAPVKIDGWRIIPDGLGPQT